MRNAAALQGSDDGVMASDAGRGAVNHYLEDSPFLAEREYREPSICPCHAELHPCMDCRKEMDEKATLRRLRLLRESDGGATDGEARDTGDDLQ